MRARSRLSADGVWLVSTPVTSILALFVVTVTVPQGYNALRRYILQYKFHRRTNNFHRNVSPASVITVRYIHAHVSEDFMHVSTRCNIHPIYSFDDAFMRNYVFRRNFLFICALVHSVDSYNEIEYRRTKFPRTKPQFGGNFLKKKFIH